MRYDFQFTISVNERTNVCCINLVLGYPVYPEKNVKVTNGTDSFK